jgi:hypothetical protein
MKTIVAWSAMLALGVGLLACGNAKESGVPVVSTSARTSAAGVPAPLVRAKSSSSGGYLNDGDHDSLGDADRDNNHDNDNDNSEDHKPDENNRYHDSDEREILHMGRAARPGEQQEIAALVKRYYAVARVGDGVTACSMIFSTLRGAVAEDYGAGSQGPLYLRSGRTCPAVMKLLFEHMRAQLKAKFVITGVRVEGNTAVALLGSKTVPASSLTLQRSHGAWTVNELVGSPMS